MRSLNKKAALIIGCLTLALVILAPSSTRADEWNLATKFEINHAFEVPGMVLQPNTRYVIRLYDSPSERNIVQIYDQDQMHMLTMFMAISDERQEATDRTQFTFVETQPQYPLPVKEWFYPGRLHGLEFIYPKDQAIKISQHALEPILAADSNNLHDLATLRVEAIGPLGAQAPVAESAANITKSESTGVFEEKPSTPEETPAVEENAPQVEPQQENADNSAAIAQNEQSTPLNSEPEVQQEKPSEPPAVTEEQRELPRTAGELPLIALIGVLCVGAGLGLKAVSAKS